MMRGVDGMTLSAVLVAAGATLTAAGGLVAQVRADVRRAEREHGVMLSELERFYGVYLDEETPPRARRGSRWRVGMAYARAMARQAVDDVIGWDADAVSAQQRRENVVEVGELER